jgi:hypothetical protein
LLLLGGADGRFAACVPFDTGWFDVGRFDPGPFDAGWFDVGRFDPGPFDAGWFDTA